MKPWERDAIVESVRGSAGGALAPAPWASDPIVGDEGAAGSDATTSPGRSDAVPLRIEVNGTAADERSPGSLWQEVGRQVGLTARHALAGAGSLVGIASDPIASTLNLGAIAAGGKAPFRSARTTLEGLADWAGLPKPGSSFERAVGTATEAMVPAAGVASVAAKVAPVASGVAQTVASRLAEAPLTQVASAGTAGLASGSVREAGGGPAAQLGAGLVAGTLTPMGLEVARAVPRTVSALVQPFFKSGRERVVGDTLRRLSSDPATAMSNLDDVAEYVPGSRPTTAQVARDPGLLIAERGMPAPFGARSAELASRNNAARDALLDALGGDDASIAAVKTARDAAAKPLYTQANERLVPADATLNDLFRRPAMRSAIARARKLAENAGEELVIGRDIPARQVETGVVDAAGRAITRETAMQAAQYTGKGLHYVKLALDDLINDPSAGIGNNERAAIVGIKRQYLDWLDKAIPEYGQAREGYAAASRPINRMELVQDIRRRAAAPTPDFAGNSVLSPAKWGRLVTSRADEIGKTLDPAQQRQVAAITADLDRSALSANTGRAAGSNTFQNLSTAYVIGRALQGRGSGNTVIESLMRPLGWLYKLPEAQAQDLLVDAMLDPAIATKLMGKATPKAVEAASEALRQRLAATVIGAAIGASTSVEE